ncbi:MAG TPA: GNAT family N-acetyltransferase [Trinickia sp.]
MKDSISIRPYEPRDLHETARLFDLYRQFYEQSPDLAAAEQFIRARTERAESVILVEDEADGVLGGFCQLYPSFCSVAAGPIYVLYDLFVAPDARRRGVGKALLAAAHERARRDGKVRMDLTTAKTNLKAQSLYESMGWVRDDVFFTYTLDVASQR